MGKQKAAFWREGNFLAIHGAHWACIFPGAAGVWGGGENLLNEGCGNII